MLMSLSSWSLQFCKNVILRVKMREEKIEEGTENHVFSDHAYCKNHQLDLILCGLYELEPYNANPCI